jgi:hypothetical protein
MMFTRRKNALLSYSGVGSPAPDSHRHRYSL